MADDGAKESQIAEFAGVTGVDTDRAKFFLESSNWQLQVALDQFFDNTGGGGEDVAFEDASEDMPEEIPIEAARPPPSQPAGRAPAAKKKSSSRFATLSDMARDAPDDSDGEEGQGLYVGGSEHSGQQVVGPKKKKEDRDSLVSSIFKQAKEHGAQEVSSGDPSVAGPSSGRSYVFKGAAYRLGESEDEPVHAVPGTEGTMPQKPRQQTHLVLKLWKNGFSISDGELRDYKDPKNAALLNSVSRGEIPMDLIKEAKGGEVNLDMEDHRTEEFVRPKQKVKVFSGQGYMLGSPTPNLVASQAPASASASPSAGSSESDNKSNEKSGQESIGVNTSQPVTSIQLRLGDGTRLVEKFNHTHTVGDIRKYISLARPSSAGRNYVLMTTFPNKELTDDSQTLADAKLLNACIVQRFK